MQTKIISTSQFVTKTNGVQESKMETTSLDMHLSKGWKVLSQSSATFGNSNTGSYLVVTFLLGKD